MQKASVCGFGGWTDPLLKMAYTILTFCENLFFQTVPYLITICSENFECCNTGVNHKLVEKYFYLSAFQGA